MAKQDVPKGGAPNKYYPNNPYTKQGKMHDMSTELNEWRKASKADSLRRAAERQQLQGSMTKIYPNRPDGVKIPMKPKKK